MERSLSELMLNEARALLKIHIKCTREILLLRLRSLRISEHCFFGWYTYLFSIVAHLAVHCFTAVIGAISRCCPQTEN